MNTLASTQMGFQELVMRGKSDATYWSGITGHMEIYIHAYRGRLIQALKDNFPVLHRALGDDSFAGLASAYFNAEPSRNRSIRWLGDGLCAYIAGRPEIIPHPALLDIARMDWYMRAAFDAADAQCLLVDHLAAIPPQDWPTLTFRTVPSFRILDMQWGVEALWHALSDNEDAQTEPPEFSPHTMLIWRQDLQCRWRTVDATEHLALLWISEQKCFAEICDGLSAAGIEQPAQHAAQLLQRWVHESVLAAS